MLCLQRCIECEKELTEEEHITTLEYTQYFQCDKCKNYTSILKVIGRRMIHPISEEDVVKAILKEKRRSEKDSSTIFRLSF